MRDEQIRPELVGAAEELQFLHDLSTPFTVALMSLDKAQEFLSSQASADHTASGQLEIALGALERVKHLLVERRAALMKRLSSQTE